MKKYFQLAAICLAFTVVFTSCRDEEEKTTEEVAEEMINEGDNVEVSEDKVKIENNDGSETKIKYDDDGSVEKIKSDDN
jgi:hypothetical protein